jgi:hypothetical protein
VTAAVREWLDGNTAELIKAIAVTIASAADQ